MKTNVAFYVSGHGYGHAARMAEVVRVLSLGRPNWFFYIRTSASPVAFRRAVNVDVRIESVNVDSGVVERDPLNIDSTSTLENAVAFMAHRDGLLKAELEFIREYKISLVVADVPYIVGDIAEATKLPCVAIGNFTWDWIYEPFTANISGYEPLIERIRRSYEKIPLFLMLPFSEPNALRGLFRTVTKVPLLARQSTRAPEEIMRALDIDPRDQRPLVLIGMRGGVPLSALTRAGIGSKDWIFLTCDTPVINATAENIRPAITNSNIEFIDLLGVCTAVISKLGYGIISDCIVNGTALLYPPRRGFREDDTFRKEAPQFLRMSEIPILDYQNGNWSNQLNSILATPKPPAVMKGNGADVCATLLAQQL